MISGWKVVDLSLPLAENYPATWPGDVLFQTKVTSWFDEVDCLGLPIATRGPFQTHTVIMSDHVGTHCDAPAHFIPPPDSRLANAGPMGLLTAEQLPLDQFMGPAVVIDVTKQVRVSQRRGVVEPDDFQAFERDYRLIEKGDIVLLRSGWDARYYGRSGYYGPLSRTGEEHVWPAPSLATVEWLLERGVKCLGTDGPSIGPIEDPGPIHIKALGSGLGIVEGLAHLDQIPAYGAHFMFFPLKLVGGSGAPGRAIGLIVDIR